MASAFKPTYLRPIPPGAERCRHKGAPAVKYTDARSRKHVRLVHRDKAGKLTDNMECEQSRWWMKWTLPDGTVRRERGYTDRQATEAEAARREQEAQLARAGVLAVDEAHLSAPLQAHIDTYVADLERAGRTEHYHGVVRARLLAMAHGCGWETLRALTPDSLTAFLVGLRRQRCEVRTVNDYLAMAKRFCRWCIETRRLAGNPLASVRKTASDRDGTNDKSALTPEQAVSLIEASRHHGLLYLVALRTGLRRGELRDLQWGDLFLDGPEPRIQLRATATKSRRADSLPLRADVASALREARPANVTPTDRVFRRLPKMSSFRRDLDRAGIPHHDERGKRVVFHSLRVTFCTWLAKSVREPRVAMQAMRHRTMALTMQYYTDPRLLDTARAVDALPDLNGQAEQQAAIRTGTDDRPVKSIAQKYVPEGPRQAITGQNDESNVEKNLKKRGFATEVLRAQANGLQAILAGSALHPSRRPASLSFPKDRQAREVRGPHRRSVESHLGFVLWPSEPPCRIRLRGADAPDLRDKDLPAPGPW